LTQKFSPLSTQDPKYTTRVNARAHFSDDKLLVTACTSRHRIKITIFLASSKISRQKCIKQTISKTFLSQVDYLTDQLLLRQSGQPDIQTQPCRLENGFIRTSISNTGQQGIDKSKNFQVVFKSSRRGSKLHERSWLVGWLVGPFRKGLALVNAIAH